jgi:hypothetical protein
MRFGKPKPFVESRDASDRNWKREDHTVLSTSCAATAADLIAAFGPLRTRHFLLGRG